MSSGFSLLMFCHSRRTMGKMNGRVLPVKQRLTVAFPGLSDSTEKDAAKQFFVAGVGASAGGLEALEQFFRHLPEASGIAFVIIQHLITEIATLFLDNELRVRRFTNWASNLFKLIPSDVGRPLTDIVSSLDYPELYDHVQTVLRKVAFTESQVPTVDGRWFLVRIMPYRTMDNRIDGVVVTCSDISAAKKLESELREENARLKQQLAER